MYARQSGSIKAIEVNWTDDGQLESNPPGRETPKPQMRIVGCPQVWLWKVGRTTESIPVG